MKIFSVEQCRYLDAESIKNSYGSSEKLMECAASTVTNWLRRFAPQSKSYWIFVGSGNNGGDGLIVAQQLLLQKERVKVFNIKIGNRYSPDFCTNMERLKAIAPNAIFEINSVADIPEIERGEGVIIDAIFGMGLSRKVDGLVGEVIDQLNKIEAIRVAIDIPSGLFASHSLFDTEMPPIVFKADYTITFQSPKLAFMMPENGEYVGEFVVTDIGLDTAAIDSLETPYRYIDNPPTKKVRSKFSHKGTYGHALLLAGSYGKMGAAILATKAALRAGVGLITTHIPHSANSIMQIAIPEAMVSFDSSDKILSTLPPITHYSAIAAGVGIGTAPLTAEMVRHLLEECHLPLLLDADALNIISYNSWQNLIPANTILTPHPKEFERLVGKWQNDYERLQKQIEFSQKYSCLLVVKGAHTSISSPDGEVWFNSTGNSGMATAGSGDVLTGIILSLLAQGYSPIEAAKLGVYLHGAAGDKAASCRTQESIIASDIIEML